ncbi:hypothetical protein A3C67_03270 [Candidatus Nomurabacteria bacterium RIFCSPHIGHO2_02_FULL_42_19]|uniref:Uncharacterized protein n=1 Tax=Candidatus Nomurabacteria bacterium RIFCSPHIGHO2_02_FULL_42_19 TaxID=1801756 RepID=A0A1F6W2S3_9BACT|nr:MAG: hypothetical protein A3C67_03270 [Candidatus Nomurabacteria bacterium RIFCSPHIGHO2_02_FULL_42_19]
MNPNWIRATVASVLLAILLKVGVGIPFLTTFVALGIIYVTQIVFTELGSGVAIAWRGMRLTANVAMGIIIFLALRFLAAKTLGLYPADTYGNVDDSGGAYSILVGHDVSSVILWEVCFAFVAGGLAVAWANGKERRIVGTIFVVSLAILSIQIAFPKYVGTWPNRDTISTTLVDNGVVGTSAKGAWAFMFGKPAPPPPPNVVYSPVVGRAVAQEVVSPPRLINATTPVALSVDYEFNLEANVPIRIKYADGQEYIHQPGEKCQQAPTPRGLGPKVFTDPKDPGKVVSFRLYRLERGEGTCK